MLKEDATKAKLSVEQYLSVMEVAEARQAAEDAGHASARSD
jgi:hypothetical protein